MPLPSVTVGLPILLLFLSLSVFALPSLSSKNDGITFSKNGSDALFVNSSSSFEQELLCADGKGPLLEGEERIFPCAGECPGGFDCEFPLGRENGGICCPNLSELYRLYKEKSGEIEEEGAEREEGDEGQKAPKRGTKPRKEGKKRTKPKEMGGVDAMALLEKHYGEGIARLRPTAFPPAAQSPPPPSPEATNLLVSSRTVEIRRSQPKQRHQQQKTQQDFVLRPRNAQYAAKALPTQNKDKARNTNISGEEYSCRRQKLELFCEDRRRQTQFVLRWYAKDRVCVSYPWGYCAGKPVASDPTIRTREECEMLCSADRLDNGNKKLRFWEERKRSDGSGTERNNAEGSENGASHLDLTKADETLEAVPSGLAEGKSGESFRGEGEEMPFAISSGAQNAEESAHETNPTASSAEFSDFLLNDQRRHPKKRCLKVSPFRSMCPDGMPSQFTLRWHFRDGVCFAYPYGYCHGESVMTEDPIKTEKECLKICTTRGQKQKTDEEGEEREEEGKREREEEGKREREEREREEPILGRQRK
ncbi:hypothetical protein niasHT_013432 [Heterodera trifolii]|uniref:BPTI/Kunitz inhibitor domain-containing protein n=1 Tax=Heterodera trifolii TaxID=157864 RepID=A0ABD2LCL1_9BILA